MKLKFLSSLLLLCILSNAFSQENIYSSLTIPANLIQNANAVIRFNDVQINLKSSSEMQVLEKRIVTVLNKEGDDAINAYMHYDNNVNIKDLEAIVYNAAGNEIKKIKKIKKKDFKDVSAVDGGTLYSDSRMKYLEYTPIGYPYTIEFNCETITSNTAFIPSFIPLNDYFLSVENSTYKISFPSDQIIRTKHKNFENFHLKLEELDGVIKYEVENIQVIKPEKYAPAFFNIAPKVLVASSQFTLEGVHTQVENWGDFGKWMYHDLIKNTHDLPENTIALVQNLVKDAPNDVEKAKMIYQYVQDKVRYISVQVGIGGWKTV